jgi:arylsulfatase A-like enzyme
LGLSGNTAVVLWGDHGFSLGEHSVWGKLTNYEHSTRAPLIVSAPGARARGRKSDALVEFVDIYPTLCELAGLPLPAHLEGTSFVPLLNEPQKQWKPAAFSQYLRPARAVYKVVPLAIPNPPGYDEYPREDTMGYTMRTDRHRFTIWHPVKDPSHLLAVELYDHRTDPAENVNLAGRPENAGLVKELTAQLHRGWQAARPGQ